MNPIEELIIALPDLNKQGDWSEKYKSRLEEAASVSESCDSIANQIGLLKSKAIRNTYTLEVYEQVNELIGFVSKMLLALQSYDLAHEDQNQTLLDKIQQLPEEFKVLRKEFERVYSISRVLEKPDGYLLDQDHHVHLANQTISFDWQFLAEILFLKKLESIF